MCGMVCVAASRSGVVLGCGCGGEALKRLQRSQNSANEARLGSSHQLATVGESVVLRAEYSCSKSDSTMWCREAAAHSAVLPSEN